MRKYLNAQIFQLIDFDMKNSFLCDMAKPKKMSVATPAEIYGKLRQRAFELNLTNREYYLVLAMQDLGIAGEGEELNEEMAEKLKQRIKELDELDKADD